MTATALDPLEVARATLRRAEVRTGVRASTPDVVDLDDGPRPLGTILDDGRLPRGAASVVVGSTSLLLALLATSQGTSDWLAVVRAPDLGCPRPPMPALRSSASRSCLAPGTILPASSLHCWTA